MLSFLFLLVVSMGTVNNSNKIWHVLIYVAYKKKKQLEQYLNVLNSQKAIIQ